MNQIAVLELVRVRSFKPQLVTVTPTFRAGAVTIECWLVDRTDKKVPYRVRFLSSRGSPAWTSVEYPASAAGCPSPGRPKDDPFFDLSVPYPQRLGNAVRANIAGSPPFGSGSFVEVEFVIQSDGVVQSYRVMNSGGDPAWQRAVLRGVARTDVLPVDADDEAPPKVIMVFQP